MWSRERIAEDLRDLRVREGDAVIVHASMRAVGAMEGGADTLLAVLRALVGPEGTVMVPAFSYDRLRRLPVRETVPEDRDSPEALPGLPIDPIKAQAVWGGHRGIFAERLAEHAEAHRSPHPAFSFAAIGKNAEFLTHTAPFHYPFGSHSPIARLHQINGGVLLLGVSQSVNMGLHLAEVYADVPYGRRLALVQDEAEEWHEMVGGPGCSAGFRKCEAVLRQARILREGYVGNAASQYLRLQPLVSMAMELLHGNPEALLCDDPHCRECVLARKFTNAQR